MNIQLIENKQGVFRLLIEQQEYTFYPPKSLYSTGLLPLPVKVKGSTMGWNIAGGFVSYWQLKTQINYERHNRCNH